MEDQKIIQKIESVLNNELPLREKINRVELGYTLSVEGENVVGLSLPNQNISVLPPFIAELEHLEHLSLFNNQLASLPEEIEKLYGLESLCLMKNKFTKMPKSVVELTNLTWLDLSLNQLRTLPSEISKLDLLEVLNLSHNSLEMLPIEIGELSCLKTLNLEDNLIQALPASIGSLKTLESLYLRKNPLLMIPETFASCTKLKMLNLLPNAFDKHPKGPYWGIKWALKPQYKNTSSWFISSLRSKIKIEIREYFEELFHISDGLVPPIDMLRKFAFYSPYPESGRIIFYFPDKFFRHILNQWEYLGNLEEINQFLIDSFQHWPQYVGAPFLQFYERLPPQDQAHLEPSYSVIAKSAG